MDEYKINLLSKMFKKVIADDKSMQDYIKNSKAKTKHEIEITKIDYLNKKIEEIFTGDFNLKNIDIFELAEEIISIINDVNYPIASDSQDDKGLLQNASLELSIICERIIKLKENGLSFDKPYPIYSSEEFEIENIYVNNINFLDDLNMVAINIWQIDNNKTMVEKINTHNAVTEFTEEERNLVNSQRKYSFKNFFHKNFMLPEIDKVDYYNLMLLHDRNKFVHYPRIMYRMKSKKTLLNTFNFFQGLSYTEITPYDIQRMANDKYMILTSLIYSYLSFCEMINTGFKTIAEKLK